MAKSSFFSDIREWTESIDNYVAEETAEVTRAVFSSIVKLSPVDTGRFVENWQVGSTSPSYSVVGTSSKEAKITEINSKINATYFLTHQSAYMVNNVDYARQVEYTGWVITPEYAPVGKTLGLFAGGIV